MLQRINFILMLVLVAAVAFLSVQLFVTQRQNAAVLREMAQRLALAGPGAAAPAGSPSPAIPGTGGLLYVTGAVKRPGMYSQPPSGRLTLSRIIASAGGLDDLRSTATVRVVRAVEGQDQAVFEQVIADEADLAISDFQLQADDQVIVSRGSREPSVRWWTTAQTALPGSWRLSPADPAAPDAEATIEIASGDGVMNVYGTPTGVLDLPRFQTRLDLVFYPRPGGMNLTVKVSGRRGYSRSGRWELDDDRLVLNVAQDEPALQVPLVFVRTQPAPANSNGEGAPPDPVTDRAGHYR